MQVFLVAQWFFGVNFLFTPFAFTAVAIGFIPLLGLYAFRTLQPNFLVLFAAIEFYILTEVCDAVAPWFRY